MAKGYASRTERKEEPEDVVVLDTVLPAGTCIICKRRPSAAGDYCVHCDAALHA